jgi:hypothetical protein
MLFTLRDNMGTLSGRTLQGAFNVTKMDDGLEGHKNTSA